MYFNNLDKLFKKNQARYLFNIFFLLGFILAGNRFEKFLYVTEDYCYYSDLKTNELVISEQATEELSLTDDDSNYEGIINYSCKPPVSQFYKIALRSYNCRILLKFKTNISNHIINSEARGFTSHGLNMLPGYLEQIFSGGIKIFSESLYFEVCPKQ